MSSARRVGFVLLPWLFMHAPAGAAATAPDTLRQRAAAIDGYVERLGKLGFSGIFVLEAGGNLLVDRGVGLADREKETSWRDTTVSDVGSITKQFTAAAILRLQEQGRLRVEDPLAKYIDGVTPDKTAITLHQLLTHTSGIVDVPDKDDWDPVTRDDIVRLTMAAPLASEPGTHFEYSNAGYSLLGVVIEKLSGRSYESFLREVLFEPTGMKDTGYILPKFDVTRIAVGYRDGARWGTTLERPFASDGPYWILRANGGIHSTARDMLRWANALLDNRVLGDASRRALWSKYADESNGDGESYYGYGWSIVNLPDGRALVTHNGGNGIAFADYAIEPAERVVLFMMSNVAAEFPSGHLLDDVGHHLFDGEPLPHLPDVQPLSPALAERIPGLYEIQRVDSEMVRNAASTFVVRVAGNTLAIEASTWRDFSRLYGAAPADLDRLEGETRTIDECVNGFLRGDYEPMRKAYGARLSLDEVRKRVEARRRDDEEQYGKQRSQQTLGTLIAEDGSMTFVRFEHERSTHYRRYVWNSEGKLLGLSEGRRGVPPLFYRVSNGFESFEMGVPSSRLSITTDQSGSLVMTFGPDGSYAATSRSPSLNSLR